MYVSAGDKGFVVAWLATATDPCVPTADASNVTLNVATPLEKLTLSLVVLEPVIATVALPE